MFLNQLRMSVRQFAKVPGFTITALLMLALGIGATTAVFSIVQGVLLRPLPFPRPNELVVLADKIKGADIGGAGEAGVTPPDIVSYGRDVHAFRSYGGYQNSTYELSGSGEPLQIDAARLTAGIWPTLGVSPLLGRYFTRQEDEGSQQVAVLSYGLWADRYHRDPRILGTKILLDRKPYQVIGVMPRGIEFPLNPGRLNRSELWVPVSFTPDDFTAGASSWKYQSVGRLKPGVTAAQAQSEAGRVAQEIMRNYSAYLYSLRIEPHVHGLKEATVESAKPLLRILFLAAVVVLLIVCANLAGLLLVRALRQRRESAVRMALGASAKQVVGQALVDSSLLCFSGGLAGVALASLLVRISVKFLPETLPLLDRIQVDWTVIAFALTLSLITGLLCGLAPAFAALQTDTNVVLKEGGRTGTAGSGHARLRSGLVIAEIAVALVLLTASGLLLRSFQQMQAIDPGFQADHALTAAYSLPHEKYNKQAVVNQFNDELLQRLRSIPGVKSAGMTSVLPMSGNTNNSSFVVDNYIAPEGAGLNLGGSSFIVGDFFRAMGIHLLRGRFFDDGDKKGSPLVAIVNRKLAEHYWPGQNPVGKRIRLGMQQTPTPWITIVGEIADVKQASRDVETLQQFYQPATQGLQAYGGLLPADTLAGAFGSIAIRTSVPPQAAENELRAAVRALDPQLALSQMQTMKQTMADSEAPRRFNTVLISAFALTAVFLAILGIYSVMAFSVALRTQEMAIRMALGSPTSGIYRLILGSGLRLVAIGTAIGLLGVYATSSVLKSFLFGVKVLDAGTVAASIALIFGFAALACLIPARRAATTQASDALRAN